MKNKLSFLVAVSVVFFLFGCGPKNPFDTIKVSGTVTVDGKPTPGIKVTFNPESSDGQPGFATTDAQGRYTLSTPSAPHNSGAIAGKYIPTFSKTETEERPPAASPEEQANREPAKTIFLIPEKYGATSTCGIDPVTVEKGQTNVFDFELKTN